MTIPRLIEGRAPQPFAEVDIHIGLVHPRVAYHASRTALRFLRDHTKLPFVRLIPNTNLTIAKVGMWPPVDTDDDETLFAHPAQVRRASSFIKCAMELQIKQPDDEFVRIMPLEAGDCLPLHQDLMSGSRTLLTASGAKQVDYEFPGYQATARHFQMRGDGYTMHFANDETSLWHEPMSITDTLTLYTQTVEE